VQDGRALLRLSPVTGRKHQLRVHCMALGMPIVNDPIYPVLLPENTDDFDKPLQLLAKSVAFLDPITGDLRQFTSPRSLSLAPR
jgi:tRNA pseudouridine32 synthase/23S rRNA pseudouridine746 synthase